MAIHVETEREGSQGITKQFEMSAASMLFDNLQKNQYQFPEKSTIRELVSNAVDATREKLTALKILKGENKVEDFYVKKEGGLFADSQYLPAYYEQKWLSEIRNDVEIIYEESATELRDTLRIVDAGVGIGHVINPVTRQSRLQGCLKLGYSTKRASNVSMGKFGIGAKSALSTGVDSYTMITRHNGREFRFEIYDYKADPLVPKFDLVTEQENKHIVFEDWEQDQITKEWRKLGEHIVYYLETDQMNGTEIIVKTKKHHRETYKNAVRSQLLYMDGVTFTVRDEDGDTEQIDFKAKIKFENELFILSDNDQFSKPHFVVNGVNYGFINYQEMDLEDKSGAIAFKVSPDKVTINPSRESFIWDDKTRAAALEMQKEIAAFATIMVEKELDEPDLFKWISKCTSALGDSANTDSIVGQLAGIIDRSAIKPNYNRFPWIKYAASPSSFFEGIEILMVKSKQRKNVKGETVMTLDRTKVTTWSELTSFPIYMQTGQTSNKKEMHLLQVHENGFVKFKVKNYQPGQMLDEAEDLTLEEMKERDKIMSDKDFFKQWKDRQQTFLTLIKESADINDYETVVVPNTKDNEEMEEDSIEMTITKMTAQEQRELQGKTVCAFPTYDGYQTNKAFVWVKREPVIKDLMFANEQIVYGFQEDEQLIHYLANMISKRENENRHKDPGNERENYEFYNRNFKLIRISRQAEKYFKKHTHISEFFVNIDINTKTISMDNLLVQWHTGRKIEEALPRMQFLENYSKFNQEIRALYVDLINYKGKHYRSVSANDNLMGCKTEMLESITDYANKVIDLQLYIDKHPGNTDAIAAKARALFEIPKEEDTFENSIGVDMVIYNKLERVLEYIEPLEHIFNYISPLLKNGEKISDQLEMEIRSILRNKGITS